MKNVISIDSFQPQPGEIVVIRMNLNGSQNAHAQAERAVEHFSELLPGNHVVVIDERLTLERVHVDQLNWIVREQKRKQGTA